MQEGGPPPATPPPSCLSDASVLLAAILRYTPDSTAAAAMKVEPLLQVWANLVAEWNAWEEEEDESVFDSIEEAVALQVRFKFLPPVLEAVEEAIDLQVSFSLPPQRE